MSRNVLNGPASINPGLLDGTKRARFPSAPHCLFNYPKCTKSGKGLAILQVSE
jgi:hypothetical protein